MAAQEVCGGIGIAQDLLDLGYTSHLKKVDWNGDSGCPPGTCGQYSNPCLYNLAATAGDVCSGSACNRTHEFQDQHPDDDCDGNFGDQEVCRGFACIKGAYILLSWWSCSAHLTSKGDAVAKDQASEYRATLASSPFAGIARIAAGDFNLTPSQGGWIGEWAPYNMDDESLAPNYQPTTDTPSLGKIDYIWAHDSYTDDYWGIAEMIPSPESDHHIVHGAFVWP